MMYPAYSQTILESPNPILHRVISKIEPPVDQSSYRNYVQQAKDSKHWRGVNFEGFVLPAQGQSKAYCNRWISYGCDNTKQHPNNQHYAEHTLKTCKVAFCPLCFESWIGRQANRTTKRLTTFLEKRRFNFRHIILSPPPDQAQSMSYDKMNKWLQTVLKIANIRTCAIIFHHTRFQDKQKSMPYVSPHFHLLVYGRITNTIEFYNKTKWTIKNKGDLKTDKDIFTCTRYLLSHCGVRKGTHAVRYLGDISYRKLKVVKEPKIPHCPYCFLPLRIFSINFDSKHEPPPINHVGLWDSSCFSPVVDSGNDTKIPFYQMSDDSSEYSEELIYSFEELLHIKMNSSKIVNHKYEMSQLKFKTSINCEKIISFC